MMGLLRCPSARAFGGERLTSNRMEIFDLYRFAATYHLGNARSWFENGQPLAPPLAGFAAEPMLMVSLIAPALWIIVPVGLSIILFNGQDITS
ncbi:MAG: hypothetical protein BMS9Abin28_1036 [Anaerolineae bacterium]|nr:MAG: hypothetical protein BMS9Abin28_1036 [Anaerolineae bacterium]